jgi:hypothetical protein
MSKPSVDMAIRIKVFILVLIVAVLALGLAYAIQQKNLRDTAVIHAQKR